MTLKLNNVEIVMNGECLGVMGPAGDRTVVRRTADGRYAVMTAAQPYRLIRLFGDSRSARRYNAAIHGETL